MIYTTLFYSTLMIATTFAFRGTQRLRFQPITKPMRLSKLSMSETANVKSSYHAIPVPGMTVEQKLRRDQERYAKSLSDPETFWKEEALHHLTWSQPFTEALDGDFATGSVKWFVDGKLNACYNALDRHIEAGRGDEVAMIWEQDEPGKAIKFTYNELLDGVSRIANVLLSQGVQAGDVVTIYLPMVPQVVMTMLACARIGAIHSVVFAGFSADALRDRMLDCKSKVVVAMTEGRRGGKPVKLLDALQKAVSGAPEVQSALVFQHPSYKQAEASFTSDPRFKDMDELLAKASPSCPIKQVDSSHPLFVLYTSGSTGRPKGVLHATGGYLTYAAVTVKNSFDLRPKDVFCCAADCGWVTGHSYIVYGPLINGVTTVLFESTPLHPTPYRYWQLIESVKATQFYTAPTAIRALMRHDNTPIRRDYDLSTLRVIGSVGEPIGPEAWRWYYENVGNEKCSVVDTYWSTETGGHVLSNLPGSQDMVPGSCVGPLPGIKAALLDPNTGKELLGPDQEGVLVIQGPWPGLAATLLNDHERFVNTYLKPYPGCYFTGDAARRDTEGRIFIIGRCDDVINNSGHRLSSAELEAAAATCPAVAEAAAIGYPHDLKGEGIGIFCVLKSGIEPTPAVADQVKAALRSSIGPIATPDFVLFADLPKTRSGKIMRRVLRKVASGEKDPSALGDTSTLADPAVVPKLLDAFAALKR